LIEAHSRGDRDGSHLSEIKHFLWGERLQFDGENLIPCCFGDGLDFSDLWAEYDGGCPVRLATGSRERVFNIAEWCAV